MSRFLLSFLFLRPRWSLLPLASLAALLPARADDATPSPAASLPDVAAISSHVPPMALRPGIDSTAGPSVSGEFLTTSAEIAPPLPPSAPSGLASSVTPPAASVPAPAAGAPPEPSAMTELVHLLVNQHVISTDAGARLVKRSDEELDVARAQAAATQASADRALTAISSQPPPAPSAPARSDDEEEVAFVPDIVKQQITSQVTQNVLQDEREERLTTPDTTPDWVKRFQVAGDVRFRTQEEIFPDGNAIGNFTNFNAINTGSGFNINSPASVTPQYDADKDRTLLRLRARIGAGVDLGEGFTSGIRIATGSDDSPVSENQTLGAANSGQGGDFGKYAIWLDRAFIKYEMFGQPDRDLSLTVGRFDNPFFHTSMLFSDDLAFDGAVVQGRYKVAPGVTPFLAAGAFPIFNTDLNFSSNQAAKFDSEDKYLFAAQTGTEWKVSRDFSAKGAVAYYDFDNIEGKVSDPIDTASTNEAGNTDDSRPSFAQNGNTYVALRDYEDPTPGTTQEQQYYGLATPFRELVLTGQLDYSGFDPFHVWVVGEVVRNLAFDRNAIVNGGPLSSPGPQNNTTTGAADSFNGGDTGYDVSIHAGKPSLDHRWDWNVSLGYRHVESDATVDGLTDSNFGGSLPGTNLKGYIIEGNLALSSRVFADFRWLSSEAIAGAPYRNDLLQFDLNARF